MFTPQQRRQWTGSASGKGKSIVARETPPPAVWPQSDWVEDGDNEELAWRRFREAGLLDEADLQRKEREGLLQRISKLETELSSYQHNMGLLLIEKNELSVKIDDLSQKLEEADEILKREQSARLISASESERREEGLKNALAHEKQCVADLEKALREIEMEIKSSKVESEKKLEEAESLESKLEEKKLEIERKMLSADASLADASVKNSQAERKSEDAENFEKKLKKEKLLFETERQILEKNLAEKEKNLQDWDIKLHESQKKLYERQYSLNEREDRINEKERAFMLKHQELEEIRKESEAMDNSIKAKEEDLNQRLQALSDKEKDFESRFASQEVKERGFIARDENLSNRELELEKKMHKLKEIESDLDSKSRALKNWEASVKGDEKKLKSERQQFEKDLKELENLKMELNILKNSLEKEKLRISRDEESLKLTRKEKEEHLMLKSQLEREIEKQREMNYLISKEMEDLRKQKEDFEREWELLDEKRRALNEERELSLRYQDEDMKCEIEDERTARYNAKLEEIKTKEEILDMEIQKRNLELDEFYKNRENELREFEKEIQARKTSEEKQIETRAEQLKREKEMFESEKQKLETDRNEFANDINTLSVFRAQIKNEREELLKDRDRVFSLIEKFKSCRECGASVLNESEIDLKDPRNIEFPKLPLDGFLKESPISDAGSSGTRFSWLKKCTKIFNNISPGKKTEIPPREIEECERENNNNEVNKIEEYERENNNDDNEGNNQNLQGENCNNMPIMGSGAKNGKKSETKRRGGAKGKRVINRTNSVAEVVKESKKILGEGEEEDKAEDNNNWKSPVQGRKRVLRERLILEEEKSEGFSEGQSQSVSVSVGGGRKKRRQNVGPIIQTPGEKRYNFRRSTIAAAQANKEASKGGEIAKPTESEMKSTAGDGDEISKPDHHNEVQQTINQTISQSVVVLGTEAPAPTKRKNEVVVTSSEIVEEEIVEEEIAVDEDGEEEEEEENEDESNKTIGKKIWNFLIS